MLKLRRLYYMSNGLDLLALSEIELIVYMEWIMKQYAFLTISYASSLENIAHISSRHFGLVQLIFTRFHISTLS